MLSAIERIMKSVSCHVAALLVPYHTTPDHPTFQSLKDPACCVPEGRPFPVALDPFTCNRYEIAEFAKAASPACTTSARSPRHSGGARRPAATRQTCRAGINSRITAGNQEYAARL